MDFKEQVVVITGAGAGIGRVAAAKFGAAGAKVVLNSLSEQHALAACLSVKETGAECVSHFGDVSQSHSAKELIETALSHFGRIDVLVNNAGIVPSGNVEETSLEEWERCMGVNVRSVFLLCRYVLPHMRKQGGGVIVNNASVAAVKGLINRAAYSASKGAVLSLTRAMASDYVKDNVRVNCVCPGTTLTPSLEERISSSPDPKAAYAAFTARQPLGRLGTPEEIAQAILFAASRENSFMTGANIIVDGGLSV
ncbi:SDR family NAD(P)-dependent oxidoreductase [Youxingia wuxianensis]|uniref:Glucose 1-dehydrogenase n=1 Tax=Youxingia wuxianensis TaxID=2763678 RepID=A0A926EQ08_9FIRM|nr:glucose 1-dehydrogenase [Youxingia wuxianensis]MBC8585287.1 glucose 1-dehydrogenase [Youxingia wuxianensis]